MRVFKVMFFTYITVHYIWERFKKNNKLKVENENTIHLHHCSDRIDNRVW